MTHPKLDPNKTDYPNLLHPLPGDRRPLAFDESIIAIRLVLDPDPILKIIKETFSYRVLASRIPSSITVDEEALALLSITDGRPGTMVLYAWMLYNWAKHHDFKVKITLDILMTQIISWGVPTEKALSEAWAAQKVYPSSGSDNALDYGYAWGIEAEVATG